MSSSSSPPRKILREYRMEISFDSCSKLVNKNAIDSRMIPLAQYGANEPIETTEQLRHPRFVVPRRNESNGEKEIYIEREAVRSLITARKRCRAGGWRFLTENSAKAGTNSPHNTGDGTPDVISGFAAALAR